MTSVISDKRKGLIEKILRFTPYILAVILWCLLAFKEQYYPITKELTQWVSNLLESI